MTDERGHGEHVLREAIESALDLLARHGRQPGTERPMLPALPLPSLLEQVQAMAARRGAALPPPVRMIHHMACTGGTMISRCIAAQANVLLLSEIEPLSTLGLDPEKPLFAPSDMIRGLRQNVRPLAVESVRAVFVAALCALHRECRLRGQYLVLRSHPHSRYCHGHAVADWPGLHGIVAAVLPHRAVVTVRHPRASYLSLIANGWKHFQPFCPDEYARRYHAFLDDHAGIEIYRYEDFVADPARELSRICRVLELPCNSDLIESAEIVRLSGDSGRAGSDIVARPPREAMPQQEEAIANSPTFLELCERLGY